jgi:hypothetical protein
VVAFEYPHALGIHTPVGADDELRATVPVTPA